MPEEPTTEAAPAAEPAVEQSTLAAPSVNGPEHTGELTNEYMQNTLDEAFKTLPGHELIDAAASPEQVEEKKAEPVVEKKSEPAEEKTPEPDTADDVVDPNDPEEKRQSTWNRLKKRAKEADAFEAQLKDFEGTKAEREALKQQLEAIKQEHEAFAQQREAMEAALYRSNVKSSPAFFRDVVEPFETLKEATEALSKENELDSEELFGAIIKGDKKKMYELTEGLHNFDQNQIFQVYQDMRHVVAARDNHYANSQQMAEEYAKAEEAYLQQQAEQTQAERTKVAETMVPKLTERVLSVLPEDRRKNLEGLRGEVTGFDQWPEHIKMYGGYASVLLPEVVESLESVQGELKAARAEIAKLRGGSPKVTSRGQPATPSVSQPSDNTDYSKMSTDSLAEQAVQRMRQSLGLP